MSTDAFLSTVFTVEKLQTQRLRDALESMQFLTGMHQTSKEFLDFGYVMLVLEASDRNVLSLKIPPAVDSYFFKDLKHGLFTAAYEERVPSFIAKGLYPDISVSSTIGGGYSTISKIFFNLNMFNYFMNDESMRLPEGLAVLAQLFSDADLASGRADAGFFEMVVCESKVVSLKFSKYPNVFVASARHLESYSSGYGTNATSAMWQLNWTTGWSIFGIEKIANPSYMALTKVTATTPEGLTGAIDQSPGAINVIHTGEEAPPEGGIGNYINPTTNVAMDLKTLIEMNAVGELKLEKAYQTGVYNLQEPVPGETATAFAGRVSQAVRSFRSISDSFVQQLFKPLLETINQIVNIEIIAGFSTNALEAGMQVADPRDLLPSIATKSFVEKGEREERIGDLRMELELKMALAQLQQGDDNLEPLQAEMAKLFPH
jgi:hypothetical protein